MYTRSIALGRDDERTFMPTAHHMWFSRALGVMTFGAFLVLTPRAWVEPEHRGATEEVPVQVLETPTGCLWCDPLPVSECDDEEEPATPPSARPWLNPDESALPLELPCAKDEAAAPHS